MNILTPLAVDLDGSLIHTDLTFESIFLFLKHHPQKIFLLFFWFLKGRAYFKRQLAQHVSLRADLLPYNQDVLEYLKEEKKRGRFLILATGSDNLLAQEVARHLQLFDKVIASDGKVNMRSHSKAQALVSLFGEKKFGYVGNSRHDVPVWNKSAELIAVNPPSYILKNLMKSAPSLRVFKSTESLFKNMIQSLRLHQWLQNVLIFLPLLTSHQTTHLPFLINTFIAFLVFSFSSSAMNLFNDLCALEADRSHPINFRRPLARGAMSIPFAFSIACLLLLAASLLCLVFLPLPVFACLVTYVITRSLYSIALKRHTLTDIIVPTSLYMLRIIVGYEATNLVYSNGLLAFSLFFFLSLAFIKPYAELRVSLVSSTPQTQYPPKDISRG